MFLYVSDEFKLFSCIYFFFSFIFFPCFISVLFLAIRVIFLCLFLFIYLLFLHISVFSSDLVSVLHFLFIFAVFPSLYSVILADLLFSCISTISLHCLFFINFLFVYYSGPIKKQQLAIYVHTLGNTSHLTPFSLIILPVFYLKTWQAGGSGGGDIFFFFPLESSQHPRLNLFLIPDGSFEKLMRLKILM